MALAHTQISAYISEETKNLVERYVRALTADCIDG